MKLLFICLFILEFSTGKPNSNPINEQDSQILTAILSKVFITENPNSNYLNSSATKKTISNNNVSTAISINTEQNSTEMQVLFETTTVNFNVTQKSSETSRNMTEDDSNEDTKPWPWEGLFENEEFIISPGFKVTLLSMGMVALWIVTYWTIEIFCCKKPNPKMIISQSQNAMQSENLKK